MRILHPLGGLLCLMVVAGLNADDRRWENPVYDTVPAAVAAAKQNVITQ